MRTLRNRDEAKREQARARNDLESYIISTRDKVRRYECGGTSAAVRVRRR